MAASDLYCVNLLCKNMKYRDLSVISGEGYLEVNAEKTIYIYDMIYHVLSVLCRKKLRHER